MPWCPKCKCEYMEGFETCSDCKVKLVDSLSGLQENEESNISEEGGNIKEAYLTTVANEIEAAIVESLLKSFGIPVVLKSRINGDFMKIITGVSFAGIDIYVPEREMDRAREILENRPTCNEDIALQEIAPEEVTPDNQQKNLTGDQPSVRNEIHAGSTAAEAQDALDKTYEWANEQVDEENIIRRRYLSVWVFLLVLALPGLIVLILRFLSRLAK